MFQTVQTLQNQNEELTTQVDTAQQQGQEQLATQQRESNAALKELHRKLARRESALGALNQQVAVANYRLSQMEEQQQHPVANPLSRSEPYKFDQKFTGTNGLSYTAFRQYIRVALAQNPDRCPNLLLGAAPVWELVAGTIPVEPGLRGVAKVRTRADGTGGKT
ncbi:hypothetical protein K3495_g1556 [Podosphaera aphanis]|nr:hypothetical protein K3495_g1556 [Podosphaera aphanis]